MSLEIYQAYMGLRPKRVPHREHWSNPDAETELTGIDHYDHPRLCRLKMRELYPELALPVPDTDAPIPRPAGDDVGNRTVRWGDAQTATFEHGEKYFKSEEEVFNYHPLDHADMRAWTHVVVNYDYSSEEILYRQFAGDGVPSGDPAATFGFYNTTFMWPLLTFGWEMFLACCLDERFEPVMEEFAEINRRAFKAMARLPVNFIVCHDDIATTRGMVCPPRWMHKFVYPRYEEYWGLLKAAGKEVIFMADGCLDDCTDDIFACGARGIISEPYTHYKPIARRHKDCFLAGEGDNRVLSRNDPAEIEAMVRSMVETAGLTGGYMMCIGNHIPWNVPASAIKRYFELSRELGERT